MSVTEGILMVLREVGVFVAFAGFAILFMVLLDRKDRR